MSDAYIEYSIETTDEEQAEIVIAELSDFGFESFSDYLPAESQIKGYIPSDAEQEERGGIERLLTDRGWKYERTEIRQQNWNAAWESNFQPIEIGSCYIHAPFHPEKEVEYPITIMPKMSFGTGHHATTALMVEAMLGIGFEGTTVLDMGSGTGILAILAALKGAVVADAIDVDEWAYENCIENVAANGAQSTVCPILGDASSIGGKLYDIILANINRNILLADMERYVAHLRPDGLLLVSGILELDIETISRHGEKLGLQIIDTNTHKGWAQITFQNTNSHVTK